MSDEGPGPCDDCQANAQKMAALAVVAGIVLGAGITWFLVKGQ